MKLSEIIYWLFIRIPCSITLRVFGDRIGAENVLRYGTFYGSELEQ